MVVVHEWPDGLSHRLKYYSLMVHVVHGRIVVVDWGRRTGLSPSNVPWGCHLVLVNWVIDHLGLVRHLFKFFRVGRSELLAWSLGRVVHLLGPGSVHRTTHLVGWRWPLGHADPLYTAGRRKVRGCHAPLRHNKVSTLLIFYRIVELLVNHLLWLGGVSGLGVGLSVDHLLLLHWSGSSRLTRGGLNIIRRLLDHHIARMLLFLKNITSALLLR